MTQPQGNIGMAEEEVIQAACTRVVIGLRKQGWKRSVEVDSEGIRCVWRSIDGRRCAVGHLMNDNLPEGRAHIRKVLQYVDAPFKEHAKRPALNTPGSASHFMLQTMLLAHDQSSGPRVMEAAFRRIAADRNLKWPEETE